jgi:hypothetical protein
MPTSPNGCREIRRRSLILGYGRAKGRVAFAVIFGLLLCCGGCASAPRGPAAADDADSDNDPAEGVNRAIFKANIAVDRAVMKPVAKAYSEHVPDAVQSGVHNVVQNLKEPAVAVNDLLQGNVGNAWQSVQRLTVNSTIGDCRRTRRISARPSPFGASAKVRTFNCPCSARQTRAMRWEPPSTWRSIR